MIVLLLLLVGLCRGQAGDIICKRVVEPMLPDLVMYAGYVRAQYPHQNYIYYQFYCYKGCTTNTMNKKPWVVYL